MLLIFTEIYLKNFYNIIQTISFNTVYAYNFWGNFFQKLRIPVFIQKINKNSTKKQSPNNNNRRKRVVFV